MSKAGTIDHMANVLDWFRRRQTASDTSVTVRTGDQIAEVIANGAAPPPQERARAWDGIMNFAAGIGTGPDKRIQNSFLPITFLTRQECEAYYNGDWVMAAAVDKPVEDMTRNWFNVVWPDKDKDEASASAIADVEDELQIRERVVEAMTWGRQFGGAALILIIAGEDDWSLPIGYKKGAVVVPGTQPNYGGIGQGDLDIVYAVDRWRLAPDGLADSSRRDPATGKSNQNFGQPLHYSFTDESGISVFNVHWSRVIRFHGRKLSRYDWWRNGRWHASVFQKIQDDVKDYAASRAATATLGLEQAVDILNIPGLAEQLSTPGGLKKVMDRISFGANLKGLNRVWVLDGGNKSANRDPEQYSQKKIDYAGSAAALEQWMYIISGAESIPVTRLFGRSPGGMNATGDSDMKNYREQCANDQQTQMRPGIMRLYQAAVRSAIGRMPPGLKIVFNPIDDSSRTEAADIMLKEATAHKAYVDMGVPLGVIMRELEAKRTTFTTIQPDDVSAAEDLDKRDAELAAAGAEAQAKAMKSGAAPTVPGKKNAKQPPPAE